MAKFEDDKTDFPEGRDEDEQAMTMGPLDYRSPMHEGRAKEKKEKSKREQAADLFNEARRIAREALEEENREAALVAEYGPRR